VRCHLHLKLRKVVRAHLRSSNLSPGVPSSGYNTVSVRSSTGAIICGGNWACGLGVCIRGGVGPASCPFGCGGAWRPVPRRACAHAFRSKIWPDFCGAQAVRRGAWWRCAGGGCVPAWAILSPPDSRGGAFCVPLGTSQEPRGNNGKRRRRHGGGGGREREGAPR